MKYLVVGLGNIGPEYAETRHNIGFMVVDKLAEKFDVEFDQEKHAYRTEFKYKGRTFVLIKPTTYMNLSGKAVRYWLNAEKVKQENLMIITDDISLPFGKIRIRAKGSDGGHNGLKSIQELLESSAYPRLRFGVGDNFSRGQQVDYVLSNFSGEEQKELPSMVEKCCEGIIFFTINGINRTMNTFNT